MFISLLSCTWISPAEHARNQALSPSVLTATKTSTTPSQPSVCTDDGYEPNDRSTQAVPIDLGDTIEGELCPESGVDLFLVSLPIEDWLDIELTGDDESCNDLSLEGTDADGVQIPLIGCRHVYGLIPAGDTLITIMGRASYTLSIAPSVCDTDGDERIDPTCGGQDCDDDASASYPGATEVRGNGIDEDCDGGDDLASNCPLLLTDSAGLGTAECGDPATQRVWDRWEIETGDTTSLSIAVDTIFAPADLFAFAVGPDGSSHYGGLPDRSELDDDIPCTGGDVDTLCPGACIDPGGPGIVTVWVALHAGCSNDANYAFRAADEYGEISAVLAGADVFFEYPFAP